MGALISTIENAQNVEENKDKARDALTSLKALADLQLAEFYGRVTNPSFDTKKLPIDSILKSDNWVYCQTQTGALDIEHIIDDTASDFAAGDAAKGVAHIIGKSLDALLGASGANVQSHEFYAITLGDLGGISRVDIKTFAYSFTSSALTEVTQNVQGASCILSSANVKDLDDNTLRVLVQESYATADKTVQQAIYDQLVKELHGQKAM